MRLVARVICTFALHMVEKDRTGPERRPLEGARTRYQRPCRRPLKPERAALALWATPVHASSMVESTADDHLTVDGDANVCAAAGAKQKVSAMSLGVMDTGS